MTKTKKTFKKWSWERVQRAVEENLKGWRIDQGEPEKVMHISKVKLICPNGHNNEKFVNHIERGVGLGCRQCSRHEQARETYEKFTRLLEDEGWTMDSTLEELLKSNRKFSQTPLSVLCPNGTNQTKTYNNFSDGKRCRCCRPKTPRGKCRKIKTLQEARERFEEKGFELLADEWNGTKRTIDGKTVQYKYTIRCVECGHERSVYASSILHSGVGCPVCSGKKETLETFTRWVRKNRPEFEVIQNQEYVDTDTKITVRCIEHDKTGEITPNNFKRGRNPCSECNRKRRSETMREINDTYDQRGANNVRWTGLTPLKQYLRTQLNDWKRFSLQAHGYTCFVTGESFEHIHHANGFNTLVEETMKLTKLPIHENVGNYTEEELSLITATCLKLHSVGGLGFPLSDRVHENFHSMYGKGNNDIDQFVSFLDEIGQPDKAKEVIRNEIMRRKVLKLNHIEFSQLSS